MESETIEARLRRLEDHEEIRQVLIEYGRTLDRRDFDGFAELFASNAEYAGGGGSDVIKGPGMIAKSLEEIIQENPTGLNSPNFHLFSNETIKIEGDEASATSMGAFVVRGDDNNPNIVMLATYHDLLIRENGRWRFKRRVVQGNIPPPPELAR